MRRRQILLGQSTGVQPARACRLDRRFSYSAYVPESWSPETAGEHRFLVAMHGTSRGAEIARDLYTEFAEEARCVVLAPLFPMAVTEQQESHNYIWVRYGDIRYDQILFDMLDEASERYGVPADRFALTGFSGGGQFSHRMLYLHPERLSAVSIGAPGMVTLLDEDRAWFTGTQDFENYFGKALDLDAVRRVPVHVVVGAEDVHPEINVEPGDALYAPGINDTGDTRVQRAQALHDCLVRHGVQSELDIVPGATHAPKEVVLAVESFMRRTLC